MSVAPRSPVMIHEPPKNLNAERAVIGAGLIDNATLNVSQDMLRGEMFYPTAHQVIWEAMLDLHNENKPVDIVSVAEHLDRHGKLDAVGGEYYLAEFEQHVLTTQNIEHYCELVVDVWRRREEIQLAHEEIEVSHIEDEEEYRQKRADITRRREELERGVEQVAQEGPQSVQDGLPNTVQDMRDRAEGKAPSGLETGFGVLDYLTAGFFPGDLVLLTGQTSSGKTAFADNLIRHWCEAGRGGVLFSLEMLKAARHMRLICLLTGVPFRALRRARKLDSNNWSAIEWARGKIEQWPLHIDDTRGLTDIKLKARVRQVAQEIDLEWVVVDYAQLVEMEGAPRNMSREQVVNRIGLSMGQIAAEHGVPVLALAQLNKDGDVRESAALGQHCDIHIKSALFIDPKDDLMKEGDPPKPCKMIVEKGRNVGKGIIDFHFYGARMEFKEAPRA